MINTYFVNLDQQFPTTPLGTTSALLEVLPEKFEIHNTACLKFIFDSRYEEFSDNLIVRCSATIKRLGTLV